MWNEQKTSHFINSRYRSYSSREEPGRPSAQPRRTSASSGMRDIKVTSHHALPHYHVNEYRERESRDALPRAFSSRGISDGWSRTKTRTTDPRALSINREPTDGGRRSCVESLVGYHGYTVQNLGLCRHRRAFEGCIPSSILSHGASCMSSQKCLARCCGIAEVWVAAGISTDMRKLEVRTFCITSILFS